MFLAIQISEFGYEHEHIQTDVYNGLEIKCLLLFRKQQKQYQQQNSLSSLRTMYNDN